MADTPSLTRFVTPKPNKTLIYALIYINRWLNLKGIPILRDVPFLKRLPGIRGLCDIRQIDWPQADKMRLQAACNWLTSTYITPNHPEFFTDWMLDKEICSHVAPMTANWATHDVVNGMGKWGQKFWLANHLIAQIPGQTNTAIDYSIQTAMQGTPVLLHPEGNVLWQGDHINHLYLGAANMALQTWQNNTTRAVYIAPVLWKLVFLKDESKALHEEMAYIEKQLNLASGQEMDLATRLLHVHMAVLYRQYENMGFSPNLGLDFFATQDDLIQKILVSMSRFDGQEENLETRANNALHAMRTAQKQGEAFSHMDKKKQKMLQTLLRTPRSVYQQPEFSQEHIAECLKRLRCDYLRGGHWKNRIHVFIPRPVGGRKAIIRVPEPLSINQIKADNPTADAAWITQKLKTTMQETLDNINEQLRQNNHPYPYTNPFLSHIK